MKKVYNRSYTIEDKLCSRPRQGIQRIWLMTLQRKSWKPEQSGFLRTPGELGGEGAGKPGENGAAAGQGAAAH